MKKTTRTPHKDAEIFALVLTFIIIMAIVTAILPEPFDQEALKHVFGFLIMIIGGVVTAGSVCALLIFIGNKLKIWKNGSDKPEF